MLTPEQIKLLIVEPLKEDIADLKVAMEQSNQRQDALLNDHGARIGKLESAQGRLLAGWTFLVFVVTVGLSLVTGWVKSKLGFGEGK